MKPMLVLIIGLLVIWVTFVAASIAQAQSQTVITTTTPPGIEVIRIPMSPTAVDLEYHDGRWRILWSDGRITSNCPADINGDGKVGVPDWLILQAAWGTDCP